MMAIRTVCFITAVVLFVNHLGWLTAIPVVGALVIPYFAVIFANGGREPSSAGASGVRAEPAGAYRPPAAIPPMSGARQAQPDHAHFRPQQASPDPTAPAASGRCRSRPVRTARAAGRKTAPDVPRYLVIRS